jgi:hypothetical protein
MPGATTIAESARRFDLGQNGQKHHSAQIYAKKQARNGYFADNCCTATFLT